MSAIIEQIVSPLKKTVSDKQLAANRANAQKSTGPRTERGKAACRRNAVKDGLTGDGLVLPEDLEAEVQAEIAVFAARFQPSDDYEHRLIRQAAVGSVRFERLQKAQDARLARHRSNALRSWDDARTEEIRRLADLLADDPAEASRLLERTAEGCDYLWDSWDLLKSTLETAGFWDDDAIFSALRLLGRADLPQSTEPSRAAELVGLALGLRDDLLPFARYFGIDLKQIEAQAPEFAETQAKLFNLVADEMDRLRTLGDELWDRYDAPDRSYASERAWVDTSEEGRLLYRYDRDATRLTERALRELETHRKTAPPAKAAPRRHEPTPAPKSKPASPPKPPWKGHPGAAGYDELAQDALAQNKPILATILTAVADRYRPDPDSEPTLESPE